MGVHRYIVGCSNESGRCKASFYRLPAVRTGQGEKTHELTARRRRTWLSKISRADLKSTSYPYVRVCSEHFVSGKPSTLYDDGNIDWAPTLKLGHQKQPLAVSSPLRGDRVRQREAKKKDIAAAQSLLSLHRTPLVELHEGVCDDSESRTEEVCETDHEYGTGTQTDLSCDYLSVLESDYNNLVSENADLKRNLASSEITEESFRGNDDKVKLYCGLSSYTALMALFMYLAPSLSVTHSSSLTKFQQMMLVLIRLKLGFPVQYLYISDVFQVSASTVSKVFLKTLNILYVKLKPCIYWPQREELRETMPMVYRKRFGLKVAVIIDCFQIFTERPSSLTARAQTWSSYKHHNTAKYLIGITPQGSVCFISPGYGGRASDKFITDDCGFLNKLLQGDIVLADRGFNIAESVAQAGCELKIPAFTKGKSQLSAVDVEQTRKLASVHIHVERVIGLIRNKFDLMKKTLPIDYLVSAENSVPTLDKIVTVCCALTNMCKSVVPFD